jgi:flagellar biosynthesis protein FlhA
LLSRDDVQMLLDRLREKQPALVNGVVGEVVSVGLIHRVLQNVLKDGIPIRDLPQILEVLGDHGGRTKDPVILTELTRKALVRTITEQHTNSEGGIEAIILEPALEHNLRNSIRREGESEVLVLSPEAALELSKRIAEVWEKTLEGGHDKAVLLCDFRVRRHLAGMLARQLAQLSVLAYDEVAIGTKVESVGTISLQLQETEMVEVT